GQTFAPRSPNAGLACRRAGHPSSRRLNVERVRLTAEAVMIPVRINGPCRAQQVSTAEIFQALARHPGTSRSFWHLYDRATRTDESEIHGRGGASFSRR